MTSVSATVAITSHITAPTATAEVIGATLPSADKDLILLPSLVKNRTTGNPSNLGAAIMIRAGAVTTTAATTETETKTGKIEGVAAVIVTITDLSRVLLSN